MATISVDYDSNGDVELILKERTATDQLAPQGGSSSTEQHLPRNWVVGCLNFKVEEVRLRVSSNKLMSSSRYFQAMFDSSHFSEAKELKEHGLVTIELLDPEDNPTAMMIVLGILYGSDVQVPTDIDLQTLHNIAVLVDKYLWHAKVAPNAISWFEKLEVSRGLPTTCDETLLMWLWIAWVFGMKDRIKGLSRVAQQCVSKPIDLEDERILLPSSVLKAINDQRETGLQMIEQKLAAFKKRLIGPKATEKSKEPEGDMLKYMIFGHAAFLAQELELGEFAALDHAGISIQMVLDRIKSALNPNEFVVRSRSGGSQEIIKGGPWDLKHTLEEAVKDLNMDKWGVEYADFKPSSGHQRVKDET